MRSSSRRSTGASLRRAGPSCSAAPKEPRLILIRPDGLVVWVGKNQAELLDALPRWFGAATRA
ncbi:hypothetical protein ACFVZW_36720 [Streptomyces sp. NPDC059567]|uniref:aromatic-ring hydroxylase C-terminal domain-containing protein n=1 Tax=Streptomyces sp. NPDC059567 TaxID=3346867 RepID=UPI00368F2367